MKIEDFKDKHLGERAFIVCSGPSLDKHNLTKLEREITFGGNSIFRHETFTPKYYSIEDWVGIRQYHKDINEWNGSQKFIAKRYGSDYIKGDDVIYINFKRWRTNPEEYDSYNIVNKNAGIFYWGSTITVLLIQLAYYMGCSPIYIIGADHWKENTNKPPEHFTDGTNKEDKHCFTNISYLNMGYRCMRENLERRGYEIYNASKGGHLEIFQRVDYEDIIHNS